MKYICNACPKKEQCDKETERKKENETNKNKIK